MPHRSTTFAQLGLSAPLVRALAEKNYAHPSPIQFAAIPHLLAGRDVLGSAQTGTGKTAAFALPILQLLAARPTTHTARAPRALILTPTRELAVQIGANFSAYGKHLPLRHTVIFGGVGQNPQVEGARVADIVVATPGRLLDLASQGHIRFDRVEIFVLDEADRMLDMGFAPDVKRILAKLPRERQSLLFSATMPPSILDLAGRVVHDPVRVAMTPESPAVERIEQGVIHVEHGKKYPLLRDVLYGHPKGLVLVFMRTKHGANKLCKNLMRDGFRADVIHGNKSQNARQRALENFRAGSSPILVATDVAARGIDVKGVSLVINYDIPNEPEAYVHRIGRTARAGAEGSALAFCEPGERDNLRGIERLIRKRIPVQHAAPSAAPEKFAPPPPERPAAAAHGHRHQPTHHRAERHPQEHAPAHHRAERHSQAHPPAQRHTERHSQDHAPASEHQSPRQHSGRVVTGYGRGSNSSRSGGFHRQRRGSQRRSWGR